MRVDLPSVATDPDPPIFYPPPFDARKTLRRRSVQPARAVLVSVAGLASTLDDAEGGSATRPRALRALLPLACPRPGHPLNEQNPAAGSAEIGGEVRHVLVDQEEEDVQPEHDGDELHGAERHDAEEGERRAAVAQRPREARDPREDD